MTIFDIPVADKLAAMFSVTSWGSPQYMYMKKQLLEIEQNQ